MAADTELVDVVDETGRPIGVVTRREMRTHRLPHRTCYIFVFDRGGRLLIHLRTATKDVYPAYWDVAVGGVLAAGESFEAGARRELHEELGIDAPLEPLFPMRYTDAHTVVQGMVYLLVHAGPFHLQAEEIVRAEFVPLEEIGSRAAREPFCPDGLAALAEYRRRGSPS